MRRMPYLIFITKINIDAIVASRIEILMVGWEICYA